MSKPADLGSVKVGSYIIINDEPCRIVEYDKSKPGKHGSAKARVVAIGIFDGSKRSIVSPVSAGIEIPIIEKRVGQVISILANSIQLMDMETFETFDATLPNDEKLQKKIIEGVEVEYWRVLGKTKIVRVKN
ncbi:MAG TPA: translation initiation factor IF-5A [Candidatus Marinimicrobia bacterium]|nr:translation initiation factor IF-5A [Candidatus Neomarinimicrobiota bacterium]